MIVEIDGIYYNANKCYDQEKQKYLHGADNHQWTSLTGEVVGGYVLDEYYINEIGEIRSGTGKLITTKDIGRSSYFQLNTDDGYKRINVDAFKGLY